HLEASGTAFEGPRDSEAVERQNRAWLGRPPDQNRAWGVGDHRKQAAAIRGDDRRRIERSAHDDRVAVRPFLDRREDVRRRSHGLLGRGPAGHWYGFYA